MERLEKPCLSEKEKPKALKNQGFRKSTSIVEKRKRIVDNLWKSV